jgi:DNA-binding CsgD family transcriptional regulator
MSRTERLFIAGILVFVAMLNVADIYTDYNEGVAPWHIFLEGTIATSALLGAFYLIRNTFQLKKSLADEKSVNHELNLEAQKWKNVSDTYVKGLSVEIENQLDRWEFSTAEKEIAFLLLKGHSIKEIASLRNTSTKTVRTQTNAIYSKSGLHGRSALSAFFLEDLLMPQAEHEDRKA